jgi:5-methylcytosine-specific restriction endonuclease McrA
MAVGILQWRRIYDRDGYRCVYCKHPLWEDLRVWHCATVDHLYPKSEKWKGSNSDKNLVAACQLCNSLKGHFIPSLAKKSGVLVEKKEKFEVHDDHRAEYIESVITEIGQQRSKREIAFTNERKRIQKN